MIVPEGMPESFTALAQRTLPSISAVADQDSGEGVQTVIWLVGLSTGLLALMVAQPTLLTRMGRFAPLLATVLLITIALGVGQRMIQRTATSKRRTLVMMAEFQIWSLDSMTVGSVRPVDPSWDCKRIALEAKKAFGDEEQDSFTKLTDLALSRSLYEVLRLDRRTSAILKVMVALQGEGEVSGKSPEDRSGLEDVIALGRESAKWERAASVAYLAVGTLFCVSCGVMAFFVIL